MAEDKVLFVDNCTSTYNRVKESFDHSGYTLVYANDYKSALQLHKTERFDVIVIDYALVLEDETAHYKKIKEINFRTEIILISLASERDKIVRSMITGVFNFVEKPVDSTLLLIYIRKAFEKIKTINYFRNLQNIFTEKLRPTINGKFDIPKIMLQSAIHNIILIADEEKIIRTVNEGVKRILGYDESYFSSPINLCDLFYKKDCVHVQNVIENAIKYGEFSFEANWKAASGEPVPLSAEIYSMKEENDKNSGFLVIGFDISHQKRLQSQIMHAEKLATMGKIAAGVAHEINNPIASITACAQSLLKITENEPDMQDEPLFSRYLKIIIDQSFRCKNIIDNLLDYSRYHEVEIKETDLQELMAEAIELTIHQVNKESQNVHLHRYPRPIIFKGDPNKIKQLFVNILSNAFDAIADKKDAGKISIKFSPIKDKIAIQIRDNGYGIDPKHINNVLDPFYTTKDNGRGTGLGLSIAKEIIDLHNGMIKFKSKSGEYTLVSIFFPDNYKGSKTNHDYTANLINHRG